MRFVALSVWPKVRDLLIGLACLAAAGGILFLCTVYPAVFFVLCAAVVAVYLVFLMQEAFIVWKQKGKP